MPVAKSYKSYTICGEPYEKNGKMYIVIAHPNTGNRREARWYTEAEYNKQWPEDKIVSANVGICGGKKTRPFKEVLGFVKGYITIFKGNITGMEDWFRLSVCRYHRIWGWYCPSEVELPELPTGITPVQLSWESVAYVDEDRLKGDSAITDAVEALLYTDTSASQFQGSIGERLDLELMVVKVIELPNGYFGSSKLHIFIDADENQYTWTTTAKTLTEGENYSIRGTIKDHTKYKGVNQTVLTRCAIK